MGYTLLSQPFSFVRFNAPDAVSACCNNGGQYLLPVVLATDVQFQFSLVFDTSAQADAAMNDAPGNIMLKLLRGAGNTPQTTGVNQLIDWTAASNFYFTKIRRSSTQVVYLWLNGFTGFQSVLKCGACFQVAVTGSTGTGNPGITGISNSFIRQCSTCDSSVVAYGSDNDYANLIYCNTGGFLNRVRLPVYLAQPQTKPANAVYRQSNGIIRRNKSVITKEYSGETDYLPEAIHDRLVIALEHDTVNVESDGYSGAISSSDYSIDWPDGECTAKAKFKAVAVPFFVRRASCVTC